MMKTRVCVCVSVHTHIYRLSLELVACKPYPHKKRNLCGLVGGVLAALLSNIATGMELGLLLAVFLSCF